MVNPYKPHLACDAPEDLSKLKFPIFALPKIDGVRGINLGGVFTGRSLKPHGNRKLQAMFSGLAFDGFDGELICSDLSATHPDLCRLTTSRVNSYEGSDKIYWAIFDYLRNDVYNLHYSARLEAARRRLWHLREADHPYAQNCFVVDPTLCLSENDLEHAEKTYLDQGFEGVILRDPNGQHKNGRATAREGAYLRIKRFTDGDAVVMEVLEGQTNGNEAQINNLGLTERSTHKANMLPNGMVGALICQDEKGQRITVAPGKMTHDQRRHYFQNQREIVGKLIRYKTFIHGRKDLPRFPTFQGFRLPSDMPAE